MKLAIVTAYPPSKVTLNEYAYHLVKSFRTHQRLDEVVVISDYTNAPKPCYFKAPGCKVTFYECWRFNDYDTVFSVIKALNQIKPDMILFNLQFMKFGDKKLVAALGLFLPWICRLKRIPTIVLLHNIVERVDLTRAGFTSSNLMQFLYIGIGKVITRLILKADLVALTMPEYVTLIQQKYNVNNVVLVPHGSFETLEALPQNPHNTGLKVMAFGKFGTYKKVETMIEAVVHVREITGLSIEIVIAGTDNPNALGYLEGVKNKYNSIPQLTFTGYVKEEDVSRVFIESTLVVFPYLTTTGSSGVLSQVGSYGKAVVMPHIGDLARLVEKEGYQGLFFEPDSVPSLASAIEKLITDEALRNQIANANFNAAKSFPMDRVTAIYLDHFSALMAKRKGL